MGKYTFYTFACLAAACAFVGLGIGIYVNPDTFALSPELQTVASGVAATFSLIGVGINIRRIRM